MHIKDPFIFTSFIAFLLAGRMMGCAAGGWCWFRPDARVEVVEDPVSLLQLILGVDRKFIRFGGGRHPLPTRPYKSMGQHSPMTMYVQLQWCLQY